MKKIFLLALLTTFTAHVFAQKELRVGEDVPSIIIEKWLANEPVNKDFKNKAIVLEFWATWCAPCIAAIPFLNALEEKFKNNPNVCFISLAGDKAETVQNFLKNKPLNSMVANDPDLKTPRAFRLFKSNSFSIPKILIINNRGIVQWIGHPDHIDDRIITKILNKCDFEAYDKELRGPSSAYQNAEKIKNDSVIQRALKIFKDSAYQNFCEVQKEDFTNTSDLTVHTIGSPEMGFYCDAHNTATAILNKLTTVNSSDKELINELQKIKINVIYKGKHSDSMNLTNQIIAAQIFNALNLKSKPTSKTVTDYILVLKDTAHKINPKLLENINSHFVSTEQFIYSGDLKNINSCLHKFFPMNFIDRTNTEGVIKFYLNKKSIQGLIQSLENYGIEVKKENREILCYELLGTATK